jgi:catechol 2,3-dioxygenase-like lactoylglutathione lyase family enzyme
MATIDHIILKVNDMQASVDFYTKILGFQNVGAEGPFTVIRVNHDFQIQLFACGTHGSEHYAFAVSRSEFDRVIYAIKAAGIEYGPSFDSIGSNTGPGEESGVRGLAPTFYFYDPNKHLLEIKVYEE